MAFFVHRRMVIEKVQQIGLRIDMFSQVESSGRYSCTVLQDGISDWSLEVQACGDNVEVYLRRESSAGGQQSVEVQLMIDDWLGSPFGRKSGRKSLTFRGPTDFRNVMSFKKSALNRWLFVPQDTMTIRGQLTVYKEVEEVIASKGDFQARSEMMWTIIRLLVLLLAVVVGGYIAVAAVQSAWHVILRYVSNVILPALRYVIEVFCLLMIAALVVYEVVESYMNQRTRKPYGNARTQGCPNDRSLVPARNRSAVRVDSPATWQHGAGQGGHGRFRRNRRMGAYDPASNQYYVYEESYTY